MSQVNTRFWTVLKLLLKHQAEVEQAAIAAYPHECCGILLGEILGSGPAQIKQVTQVWPTENRWTPAIEAEFWESQPDIRAHHLEIDDQGHNQGGHSQGDRFWIDPRELLQAQKFARSQHWNIVGIYHSHPDHPAVPSERDRLSAWSDYSYVILSVRSGTIVDCQSWTLNNASQFEAEAIELE